MGQCYEALGDMKESLKIYIQGLNEAKMSEDVKLKFLVRIIEKFPDLDVRGGFFNSTLYMYLITKYHNVNVIHVCYIYIDVHIYYKID